MKVAAVVLVCSVLMLAFLASRNARLSRLIDGLHIEGVTFTPVDQSWLTRRFGQLRWDMESTGGDQPGLNAVDVRAILMQRVTS